MASLVDALLGGQQGPIPLASLMPKPGVGNIPLASMMGMQSAWPGAMNQADAVQQTAGQAGDWLARKHQEGIDAGNWNPETHTPTQQALADGLNQYGRAMIAGTSAPGRPGFTAYHGSPHSFDKFDLSKIGTGEGAQAYGHGMYLAENEGVAQGYKQTLSRRNIDVTLDNQPVQNWGQTIDGLNNKGDWRVAKLMDEYGRSGGPIEDFIQHGKDWYRNDKPMQDALGQFQQRVSSQFTPGHMYEVRVNADPEKFLHWDKPLSEQHPEVQAAFAPGGPLAEVGATLTKSSRMVPTGSHVVALMNMGAQNPAAASEALQAAGIPGIRYLDQGSRGAGDGTHNAVVFSPETMEIIRRYGLAGLMGGGATAATQTPDQ